MEKFFPAIDTDAYLEYVDVLRSQSVSLSALGFSKEKFSWRNPTHRGKVGKLRAIIPSANESELLKEIEKNELYLPKGGNDLTSSKQELIAVEVPEEKTGVKVERIKFRYDFHGFKVVDDGAPLAPPPKKKTPRLRLPKSDTLFEGKIIQKTITKVKEIKKIIAEQVHSV